MSKPHLPGRRLGFDGVTRRPLFVMNISDFLITGYGSKANFQHLFEEGKATR